MKVGEPVTLWQNDLKVLRERVGGVKLGVVHLRQLFCLVTELLRHRRKRVARRGKAQTGCACR